MTVGRGFLSPSGATAGETQPSKPQRASPAEVTLRAREIEFRANGLGGAGAPPETGRPVCCAGPRLAVGRAGEEGGACPVLEPQPGGRGWGAGGRGWEAGQGQRLRVGGWVGGGSRLPGRRRLNTSEAGAGDPPWGPLLSPRRPGLWDPSQRRGRRPGLLGSTPGGPEPGRGQVGRGWGNRDWVASPEARPDGTVAWGTEGDGTGDLEAAVLGDPGSLLQLQRQGHI